MTLENELGYVTPLSSQHHAAVLNIYFTATSLRKFATDFFQQFGLTDVQFNLLMMLRYQSGDQTGISQTRLSELMLVNRANITSLIDRMEKATLVKRTSIEGDRRTYFITLTPKSKKLIETVEPLYLKKVEEVIAPLKEADQKLLIRYLEKIRQQIETMSTAAE